MIIVGTLVLNQFFLELNYSKESLPAENVVQISAGWEGNFENMNWRASEVLDIDIIEENKNLHLGFSHIPEIYNKSGVSQIILTDFVYWDYINESFAQIMQNQDENLTVPLHVINPPQVIWQGYTNPHWALWSITLEDGRFPVDGGREVLISKNMLREHFDFSENMLEEAIGRTITVQGMDHVIVGIYNPDISYSIDLVIISFEPEENFGFYSYNEMTFDDFISETTNFKEELGWEIGFDQLTSTLILVEEGYEPELLSDLMSYFPSSEFFSYTYSKAWMTSLNQEVMNQLWFRNLLQMGVVSLIGLIFASEIYKILKERFKMIETHYVEKKKTRNAFIYCTIIGYSLVLILALVTSQMISALPIFNPFHRQLSPIIIINVFLFAMFPIGYYFWKFNSDRDM